MLRVGSASWRRKRRRSEDSLSSEERIDDNAHVKRRKREKKAGSLFSQPEVPAILQAVGVVTTPYEQMSTWSMMERLFMKV